LGHGVGEQIDSHLQSLLAGLRWIPVHLRVLPTIAQVGLVAVKDDEPAVVEELEGVLKEFSIPLDVIDGNLKRGEDVELIQTLLDSSIKDNEINYDEFEWEIRKARKEGRLHYGLVILVDKDMESKVTELQ